MPVIPALEAEHHEAGLDRLHVLWDLHEGPVGAEGGGHDLVGVEAVLQQDVRAPRMGGEVVDELAAAMTTLLRGKARAALQKGEILGRDVQAAGLRPEGRGWLQKRSSGAAMRRSGSTVMTRAPPAAARA